MTLLAARILGVACWLGITGNALNAQQLVFARTFDNQGGLIDPGKEFSFQDPNVLIAVKFVGRSELPIDTLFVIVKDINGVAGRFYMKTSGKNRNEANTLIRLKHDGIYRVYIYNPARRVRPIAHASLYITSSTHPDQASLLERQRKILVERGVIKDRQAGSEADPYADAEGKNTAPQETTVEDEFDDLDFAFEDALEDEEGLGDSLDDFDEDSIDDDLELEDEIAPEDFSGEFESFDELDDDFDFEIDDF